MAGGWAPQNADEWMRDVEQRLRILGRGTGAHSSKSMAHIPADRIIDGSTGAPTSVSMSATALNEWQATAAGPPPTPSTPTTEARLGTVTLCWDGLTDMLLLMPKNLDRVEIHRSQEAGFTPTESTFYGYIRGASCTPVTDQPYNSVWYYRLVAVNTRGERSAPSAAVSAVTVPLVDTDIIGKIIDGANIVDGSINAADAIIANTITGALIQALAIKAGHLDANSVTTPALAAGAITAEKLAALLVLAGTMASGTTGRRWEADVEGIRLYDADGSLLINLPTDINTPATFKGDVVARSFTSLDQFALRGTVNEVSRDSVLTLAAGTTAPASPPSVLVYTNGAYVTNPVPDAPAYDPRMHGWVRRGGHYYTAQKTPSTMKISRFDATTFALDTGYVRTIGYQFPDGGMAVIGSTAYILNRIEGSDTYYVNNVDLDTGANFAGFEATSLLPNVAPGYWPAIGTDGTNLLIAYRTTSGSVNIRKLTTAGAGVETITTNVSGWTGSVTSVNYGTFDYGANRYVITTENRDNPSGNPLTTVLAYSGSGSVWNVQANEAWPVPGQVQGMCWDATKGQFVSLDSSALFVSVWSGITWTTETSMWWASTTWYDPDAGGTGTHESDQGPRTSFTMRKRGSIRVTSSPIPPRPTPNTADDVRRPRFYLGRGATDPGRAQMERQSEVADDVNFTERTTTVTLPTVGSNATNPPPATNNFPGATPGQVTSTGGGIVIKGDGTGNFGSLVVAAGKTNLGTHLLRAQAIDTGTTGANVWTPVDFTASTLVNEDSWTLSADGLYWTCPTPGTYSVFLRLNLDGARKFRIEMDVETSDGLIRNMGMTNENGHDYCSVQVPACRMGVGHRISAQVYVYTTAANFIDTSLLQVVRLG